MRYKVKISSILFSMLIMSIFFCKNSSLFGIYTFSLELILAFLMLLINGMRFPLPRRKKHLWICTCVICYLVPYIVHGNLKPVLFNVLPPIIIITGIVFLIKNEIRFDSALHIIVYVIVILSGLSILETFTSINIWDLITNTKIEYVAANGYRFGLVRARGPFETSINNGMFLVLGQGILLYILSGDKNKKGFYRFAYILDFLANLLVMSRATIIASLVLPLVLSLKSGIRKVPGIILKMLAIVGAVYAFSYIFNIVTIHSFIGNIANSIRALTNSVYVDYEANVGGIGHRLQLFKWVYDAVSNHRLFGLGEYGAFQVRVTANYLKTSIENFYLYQFFRYGFVGLVCVIAMLITFMIRAIVYDKEAIGRLGKNKDKLTFPGMVVCVSVIYLLLNFTCAGQNDMLLYYVIIGMTLAYSNAFLH